MAVLTKKYRTFINCFGNWTDPFEDYGNSTTYHPDSNAHEFDSIDEAAKTVDGDVKFNVPDLPTKGVIEMDQIYKWNNQYIRCRQTHNRTIYDPTETPALFSIFRKESSNMEWIPGEKVDIGVIRLYKDKQYQCIQAHQTEKGWEPDKTSALWKEFIDPGGEITDWVQPAGAHDAYNTGDQVRFEGAVWESTIDANVWSPTAYPVGWIKI